MCIDFFFKTLSNADDSYERMSSHLEPPEKRAKQVMNYVKLPKITIT